MSGWAWSVLVLAVTVGCSDGSDDVDAGVAIDARAVAIDASTPGVDAGPAVDAAPVPDGAPPPDGPVPDAPNMCGKIGKPCGDSTDCGAGFECVFSVGGSFCAKPRPGCGGFAGATCDDPSAPLCHYIASATAGICVDAFERDCICAGSPDSIEACP